MKIAVGCDHGGLEHKNAIAEHLKERGFEVADYGIYADWIGSVSDENGGELLGDHDFVAEYECKTGEISFDLWG